MADASAPLLTATTEMPPWRRSTPQELLQAFEEGDARRFARAMRPLMPVAQPAGRRTRRDLHPYQQALWSRFAFATTDRSEDLAELLVDGMQTARARSSRKQRERRADRIASELARFVDAPSPDGFDLLAWMHVLLHEPQLPDDLFLTLWSELVHSFQPLLETSPELAGRLTTDQRALLLGELPWSYGIVFSTLQGARRARETGARRLRTELRESCDDNGMPNAALLQRLALCVAPFTRAANLGQSAGKNWFNRDARSRYRKLVLRSAALLQPDGRTALSNGVAPRAGLLLQAATTQAGLKRTNRAALLAELTATANSNAGVKKLRSRTSVAPRLKKKHRPSAQSDHARLACLRNNWGVGADACIVAFDGETPRIDLTAFGIPVFSGEWGCADQAGRSTTGEWECVCWFTDANVDYVELHTTGSDGRRVLRQALLSRDDHFLLLSDAVHAKTSDDGVQHRITLPLRPGATAQRDSLTREWCLNVGPLRMRVLPLGLSQPGVQRADGNLSIDSENITLTQSTTSPRLACPLLLDWSPARRKAAAQWRQLTVVEDRRILNEGEAAGARWRIGNDQWLYFHSLDGSEQSRTVLGMHTLQETVIAELNSGGDVEPLVEVDHKTNAG